MKNGADTSSALCKGALHSRKNHRFSTSDFKRNIIGWIFLLPALFCIYFLVFRPTAMGVIWSFFNMKGYTVTNFIGFDNYKRILTDTLFLKILSNTVKYVVISLLISFSLPIFMAVCLNETRQFRDTFRFFTYMPYILPGVASYLLWYFIYYPNSGGLLNMLLSCFGIEPYGWLQDPNFTILYIVISMAWGSVGGTTIYYYAAIQGINPDLFEAAIIDGAGFFRRIKDVVLPQIANVILLMLVTHIIGIFSVMEQPMQMTDGGPNNASMTLGLLSYRYGFVNFKPQLAMAVGSVMFVILVFFTSFYFHLNKKAEENL